MAINAFNGIRFFIGCLLVISGVEKLIGPYQNFLYVVQSYQLLNVPLEENVARLFPWIEFLLGVFLVLGLWLKWVVRGAMCLFVVFVGVVGQAILRKLPLEECGCFGNLISFPLPVILIFDVLMLFLTGLLASKEREASAMSLDQYFSDHER